MKLVGIDIGKNEHTFAVVDKDSGEIIVKPSSFENNIHGFDYLVKTVKSSAGKNEEVLFGMEDTGHYHKALAAFILTKGFRVAMINPLTTDNARKMSLSSTKTDNLDTLNICDLLSFPERKKIYRIIDEDDKTLSEMKSYTRLHHTYKEELNIIKNRLQKAIDIVFPEFNSLFKSKYGKTYMNILRELCSARIIAHTDIRTIRNVINNGGKGRPIALTAKKLKDTARKSVATGNEADEMSIRHMVAQIEQIEAQLKEVDKKIEEFSTKTNSPIISIPGISHFSGTSILSELGDMRKYSKPSKIIKFAGVNPKVYESSQYAAKQMPISKKGSSYLRKTLYQVITPVINNNDVFKEFYLKKIAEGKSHRCAQGHCVRKLLRVIYHLETTGQRFDPEMLR